MALKYPGTRTRTLKWNTGDIPVPPLVATPRAIPTVFLPPTIQARHNPVEIPPTLHLVPIITRLPLAPEPKEISPNFGPPYVVHSPRRLVFTLPLAGVC